jgi:Tfp pilus assembly protein PilF
MNRSMLLLPFVVVSLAAAGPATKTASSKTGAKLKKAYSLMNAGKNAEAIKAFGAVLKGDPKNFGAVASLGYLNLRLKHYETGARYLQKAASLDPSNMQIHMDRGYALMSLKRADEAASEFQLVADEPGELQAQAQAALKVARPDKPEEQSSASAPDAAVMAAAVAEPEGPDKSSGR